MPGLSAIVFLLAGVLLLWLAVRLVVSRSAPPASATASGAGVVAASAIGVLMILAGAVTSAPVYAAAAGVAAIATGAAIGIRRDVGRAFGAPAYAIPSLAHKAPGTPGTLSAAAAFAGAFGAFATAALAFRLRFLGPSDPALIALAAYLAMLCECWLAGKWPQRGPIVAAIAALIGALIGAALVILLP